MSRFWKFLSSLTQPPPSKLNPRASNFDYVADEYDRSRPNYSPIIFDTILDKSFKDNCKAIADIGAGTGKLTSLLTQYFDPSVQIYAVEPLEKLREKLSENFTNFNNVKIFDALSDRLSFIEDNSIDAIFCGTSFHWFCDISTLKEFERILSGNDSYLICVWNRLSWDNTRFLTHARQIFGEEPDKDAKMRRDIQNTVMPQNLIDNGITSFKQFTYKVVDKSHKHKINGYLFIDLIKSSSRWASLPEKSRGIIIQNIKRLIIDTYGSFDVEIEVPYSTLLMYAKCDKTNTE